MEDKEFVLIGAVIVLLIGTIGFLSSYAEPVWFRIIIGVGFMSGVILLVFKLIKSD